MNPVTLPPSPNWYLNGIFSSSKDGTIAWGSRDMIVIGKRNLEIKEKVLQYSIITKAHKDKVNCVVFSPDFSESEDKLLASGGDDHFIKIWDMDSFNLRQSHQYLNNNEKIISLDWSQSNPKLIYAVSNNGCVLAWNIANDSHEFINLERSTATVISSCPHKDSLVAVGTKSGVIYILEFKELKSIVHILRNHETEVTSLSWCPVPTNIFNDNAARDLLLASTSKDNTVLIWRAGGDGYYEMKLILPNSPKDSNQHRTKPKQSSTIGTFTSICWIESKFLLVSSMFGELLSLELNKSINKYQPNWNLVHGNHGKILFSISCKPKSKNEVENWRETVQQEIWTTGLDRLIVCCNLNGSNVSTEFKIQTQGGFVYCMDVCKVNPSKFAFGAGDALLRVWNVSEPYENSLNITTFWQKIMGKIRTIAWHPTNEHLLAFGTGEGRVGVFEVNKPTKPPTLFYHYHRGIVYNLGWSNNSLCSCGDKQLIEYKLEDPKSEPKIITKDCSTFAWSPDADFIAIGSYDGTIKINNCDHEICGRAIYDLKKPIECLVWHPNSTAIDSQCSPFKNYLAVATSGTAITVIDLSNMISQFKRKQTQNSDDVDDKGEDSGYGYRIVATLTGHSNRVLCLAWNPHLSGQLVSGSDDRTAQVWNIETKSLIATYTDHVASIYSCIWSPLDPDLIITGSQDFTLRIWRLSQQAIKLPDSTSNGSNNINNNSKKKKKKSNNKYKSKNVEANGISNDNVINKLDEMTINEDSNRICKLRKLNLLPIYRKNLMNKETLQEKCLNLAKRLKQIDVDIIPSVFGDENEISSILNIEQEQFGAKSQESTAAEINIWNDNLKQQLLNAAKDLRLNDFLISLASNISVKMWQEMCRSYANQLIYQENPIKAVSYLLCIHKIFEAIDILLNAKLFIEAYVLAKCKLDKNDPQLNRIIEKWSEYSVETEDFEDASKCFIALGNFEKATECLTKCSHVELAQTVSRLALLAEENNVNESVLATNDSHQMEKC